MILTHIIANVSYYDEMGKQQELELQQLLFSRSMLNTHTTVCILIHIATMPYFQNPMMICDIVCLAKQQIIKDRLLFIILLYVMTKQLNKNESLLLSQHN